MATIWKSTNQKSTNQKSANQNSSNPKTGNTFSGMMLVSWSRQQKLAMFAGFAILGLLLVVSACSKQASKPALVAVSSNIPSNVPGSNSSDVLSSGAPAGSTTAESLSTSAATATKKTHKKRPANVMYRDDNSGVSFLYPRKFRLATGDDALVQF